MVNRKLIFVTSRAENPRTRRYTRKGKDTISYKSDLRFLASMAARSCSFHLLPPPLVLFPPPLIFLFPSPGFRRMAFWLPFSGSSRPLLRGLTCADASAFLVSRIAVGGPSVILNLSARALRFVSSSSMLRAGSPMAKFDEDLARSGAVLAAWAGPSSIHSSRASIGGHDTCPLFLNTVSGLGASATASFNE